MRARHRMRPNLPEWRTPRTLSEVLTGISKENRERVSIGDVEIALAGRSFGPFVIAFALPNLLPFPPGTSTILGLPLLVIAWQLAVGRKEVWLPGFLRRRSISHERFCTLHAKALPHLEKTERMMRPRKWPLGPEGTGKTVGLFLLLMALITVIPVPFANWLPAAAAFCIGVALTAKDGLWLGAGILIGMAAIGVFGGILFLTGAAVNAVAG